MQVAFRIAAKYKTLRAPFDAVTCKDMPAMRQSILGQLRGKRRESDQLNLELQLLIDSKMRRQAARQGTA